MNWLDEIGNDFYEDEIVGFQDEAIQDNEAWRKERMGNITGSNFGKLVVKDKKGGYTLSASQSAENLIYRIAWERLLKSGNTSNGLQRLDINSRKTNYGSEWEEHARMIYEETTGNKVIYDSRYFVKDEFIGGTPDGLVGEDGIIEIKCPYNGGNHLKTMLTGKIYNSEYIYQIQGYLWITGRDWCDFVTYDPDLPKGFQLNILKIERDETIISGIKIVLEMAKWRIQEILSNEKLKTNVKTL